MVVVAGMVLPDAVPATAPVPPAVVVMVATPALLAHVPPVVALSSVATAPWHIASGPVIVAGRGLTTTVFTSEQAPAVAVKVISAVPAATPDTVPMADTVATVVLLLAQLPGTTGDSERAMDDCSHSDGGPLIAGCGLAETV